MIKVLKVFLRSFLILYFFILANILFWGSLASFFVVAATERTSLMWMLLSNIIFAPFFIYASVRLVQKDKKRFDFVLYLITIFWAVTQIIRFTLITGFRLEMTDLTNFLIFAVEFGFVYLGKYLDRK